MDKLNLPSKPLSQRELSANEFQEKLYNWLQDQGLVSELRGYLRKQMVTAFQDTAAGVHSNKQQFSLSPKVQALSILVAEFLLHQGFSYALSVFVTEAPIIGQMFSQFSRSVIKQTLETGYRFTPCEVEDILETLGLVPGSELFMKILSLYHDNGASLNQSHESLLLCIIKGLVFMINRKETEFSSGFKETRGNNGYQMQSADNIKSRRSDRELSTSMIKEPWFEGLDDSLPQSNPKLCPVTCLQEYMKRVHEEELAKVREEEAMRYQRLLEEKLKEYESRDLTDKHLKLKEWKENVEAEFNERERNLCELAGQLRAQHKDLSEKVMYLEVESQEMKENQKRFKDEQEKGIKELEFKQSEIELQKARLNEAYERLAIDQETMSKMQKNLLDKEEVNLKKEISQEREMEFLKGIQEQYVSLCQVLTEKKFSEFAMCPYGAIETVDDPNIINKEDKILQTSNCSVTSHNDYDNEIINKIEDEKRELSERVSQQRNRIDELTIRAAELSNQLQDAQVALQLVMPNHLAVTTPPLTAPPSVRLNPRPQWPPHIGSGEETSFAAMRPAVPNVATATTFTPTTTTTTATTARLTGTVRRSDLRRRPRKTVLQQNRPQLNLQLSSDDSTATTDELIEDARIRLRRLEQESTNVQHNYQVFWDRQNNFDHMAPVYHPELLGRINPFNNSRRTNYSSSFTYPIGNITRPTSPSRSFISRPSHLSGLVRPVFSSFYSDNIRDVGGDNSFIPSSRGLHNDDNIAKELEESLTNNVLNKIDETSTERFLPPIHTMSPTDVNTNRDNDYQQPLLKKVVENTLKNHSPVSVNLERNEKPEVYMGDNSKTSGSLKEDNVDFNRKKGLGNHLQFSSMVTVVNELTGIRSDLTAANNLVQNQARYSVVNKPLKLDNNGNREQIGKRIFNNNHRKGVEIVDVTDTESSDEERVYKSNKHNKQLKKNKSEQSSSVIDLEENNMNLELNKNLQQCKPNVSIAVEKVVNEKELGPIENNKRGTSPEELSDEKSLKVILQEKSLKSSSSSTQPKSENKTNDESYGEHNEHGLSNSSNEKRTEDHGLFESQSLPVPPAKSFFASEDEVVKHVDDECDTPAESKENDETTTVAKLKDSKGTWYDLDSADKNCSDCFSNQEKSAAVSIPLITSQAEFSGLPLDQVGNTLPINPDHISTWREPGDGTDEVISESDGAVSAGTQDSASSFW